MALDDDILGGVQPSEMQGSLGIDPDAVAKRQERKGVQVAANDLDFGADDKPFTAQKAPAAADLDFGADDVPPGRAPPASFDPFGISKPPNLPSAARSGPIETAAAPPAPEPPAGARGGGYVPPLANFGRFVPPEQGGPVLTPEQTTGPMTQMEEQEDTLKPGEFSKGFQGSLLGTNPKTAGDAMEAMGHLTDSQRFIDVGHRVREVGEGQLEGREAKVPSFTNIRTDSLGNFLGDVSSYAQYGAGSALGSAAPGLVLGGAAAMLTANPFVGIGIGMLGPSYIQNWGDVYGSSKEDAGIRARLEKGELSQKDLAKWTAVAGAGMALFDIAGVETILGATFFKEAKGALGKAIVKAAITGGLAEGSTEALQEVVSQWAQHYLGSNTTLKEKVIAVIDNGLQGLFGGVVMGAGGRAASTLRPGAEEQPGAQPGTSSKEEIDEFLARERGARTREEIDEFIRQKNAREAAAAQPPGGQLALPAPAPSPGAAAPETAATSPASPAPPAGEVPAADAQTQALQAYGYTDDQIAAMSPEQKAKEARAAENAGVKPGRREAPVAIKTAEDVLAAAQVANQEHTPAQGEANNVQRGHMTIHGLPVTIEAPPGGVRRGVAPDGTPFEQKFPVAYGYIKGTQGKDGDQLDVFIGPKPESQQVFVLNENDDKGKFKQTKSFLGMTSEAEVREAYLATDGKSEDRIHSIVPMPVDAFKTWVKEGNHRQPAKRVMREPDVSHLPPVPAGQVRLYRGDTSRPGQTRKAGDENGRWFTDDAKVGQAFADDSGGKLLYVDVPKEVARKSRRSGGPLAKAFTGTHGEYVIPEADMARAQPVEKPKAAAPQRVTVFDDGGKTDPAALDALQKKIDGGQVQWKGDRAWVMWNADGSFENRGSTPTIEPRDKRGRGGVELIKRPDGSAEVHAYIREDGTGFGGSTMPYKKVEQLLKALAKATDIKPPPGGAPQPTIRHEAAAPTQEELYGENDVTPEHEETRQEVLAELEAVGLSPNRVLPEDIDKAVKLVLAGYDVATAVERGVLSDLMDEGALTEQEVDQIHGEGTADETRTAVEAAEQAAQPETPATGAPTEHAKAPAAEGAAPGARVPANAKEAQPPRRGGEAAGKVGAQEAAQPELEAERPEREAKPQPAEAAEGERPERANDTGRQPGRPAEGARGAPAERPGGPREAQPAAAEAKPTETAEDLAAAFDAKLDEMFGASKPIVRETEPKGIVTPQIGAPAGSIKKLKKGYKIEGLPEGYRAGRVRQIEAHSPDTQYGVVGKWLVNVERWSDHTWVTGKGDTAQGALDDAFRQLTNPTAAEKQMQDLGKPRKTAREQREDVANAEEMSKLNAAQLETIAKNLRERGAARVAGRDYSLHKRENGPGWYWRRVENGVRVEHGSHPTFEPWSQQTAIDKVMEEIRFDAGMTSKPTKAELAGSAAKNLGGATVDAFDGLIELFGGGKTIGAGLNFDQQTYEKAKPLFIRAAGKFMDAIHDVAELMRRIMGELQTRNGFSRAVFEKMKPYILQFMQDVQSGAINLAEAVRQQHIQDTGATEEATNERPGTQEPSERPLGEMAPSEGERPQGTGTPGRGVAGGGGAGAEANRPPQATPPLPGARGEGGGAGAAHPPQAGAGGGPAQVGKGRGGRAGARAPEKPAGVTPSEAPSLPAINYRITDETELGHGTEGVKFRDNIAAIETLKMLEREQRRPTAEEQRKLARYVGWGGLSNAFADLDGKFKEGWETRGQELASLLTQNELRAARRSTRNAHYTSRDVIDVMWEGVQRLGFKGGLVLESSSGTGNFLGLVPEAIAGHTKFVAVEYDSITARIAKALYPQEAVLHEGLHKVPLPDGEFMLNIGNPPFGSESLRFQYKPALQGLSIHNQFFLAGMDALAPGGIQAMVVSHFLMDAQDSKTREELAKRAKFLGGIRLPDTAFKENARTEVVTDILFFQRHTPEQQAKMEKAFDNLRSKDQRTRYEAEREMPDWLELKAVKDPLGGEPMMVNAYFADNRRMIMGTLERSGTMRAQGEVNVKLPKGEDLKARMREALPNLRHAATIDQGAALESLKRHKAMAESLAIAISGAEVGHVEFNDKGKLTQVYERETPSGALEMAHRALTPDTPWSNALNLGSDGKWYSLEAQTDEKGAKVKQGKRNVYVRKVYETEKDIPGSMKLGQSRFDRLQEATALRDLVKRQLYLEAEDRPEAEMEENRKKLNKAYDAFVNKHGFLHDPKNDGLLSQMPDGALVTALETSYRRAISKAKAEKTGQQAKPAEADKAAILSRRVVVKPEPISRVDSPQDALQISLGETGGIDLPRIASLLGVDETQAKATLTEGEKPLAFFDPETNQLETADAYLSGQIIKKLKAAEAAGLDKNADALRAVKPEPWTAENVTALIGANWVPADVYRDFAAKLAGGNPHVSYAPITNSFELYLTDPDRVAIKNWQTERASLQTILGNMLNSRPTRVFDEDENGGRVLNQTETALAAIKQKEIENEWADWVYQDGARRNRLVDIFNEKFNTRVRRQHDGSHLTLPGKVPDAVIKLRRHQKNAVWRGIHEKFVLYDHVVGAGKTFTAIARMMERKRMGLSKKPTVVVPNHLVQQWAESIYQLYPGAKVLAASTTNFDRKNRRRLFARIATGDWDAVVMPHSSLIFVGISPDTEMRFLEEELQVALAGVEAAKAAAEEAGLGGRFKPFNVKQAEQMLTRIETRMDNLRKKGRDNLLTFEQMGIDDLTIDESHEFKNLFYSSRLIGVRGMGPPAGSQRALDLYNKVRVLRENPKGSVVFMSGTPVSNSAVELYTIMRYLAAEELHDLGIEHFDAWRVQSVSAQTRYEPTESGSGVKEVARLGRSWTNMRALMELYYSIADAVTQQDINTFYAEDNNGDRFPVPLVKHGGRKEVVVKPTEAQLEILQDVIAGFNSLPGITDQKERNASRLRLMDRARKVSLDARAANRNSASTEEGGKLDVMADNIHRIWQASTGDLGTQLVFLDRGVKASKGDATLLKRYDELIAKRDKAVAENDEAAFQAVQDELDKFDRNEMEELRIAQRGGWNAYDQLKQNLIARGIPSDQIRFVQEANTDLEKQTLFDAVNDGQVRVMIGSTPRMGAGTNVQERLVGLHHGDVTWKPSDIEQREGRIIRQGNSLLEKYGPDFEVEILAYVTERTIDAKMWDLNSQKLKMVNGIRKYDGSFTMEFEDEDAVGMAEIAALASGDPLLLERVKLQSDIDKLELLERAYRRKQFGIEDSIAKYERALLENPERIQQVEAIAKDVRERINAMEVEASERKVTVEGAEYDTAQAAMKAAHEEIDKQKAGDAHGKFAINVNGQRYTAKDAVDGAIDAALGSDPPVEVTTPEGEKLILRGAIGKHIADAAKHGKVTEKGAFQVGTMLGYDLELEVNPNLLGGAVDYDLYLSDAGKTMAKASFTTRGTDLSLSPQGGRALLTSIEKDAKAAASSTGDWLRRQLEDAERELPALREQKGAPFKQRQELDEKRQRFLDVNQELADRAKAAEGGRGQTVTNVEDDIMARKPAVPAPAELTETAQRREHEIVASLAGHLQRMLGGQPVRVELHPGEDLGVTTGGQGYEGTGVENEPAAGNYTISERLIRVAIGDAGRIPEATLMHEMWHDIEMHLLPDREVELLKRETPRLREELMARYPDGVLDQVAGYEVRAFAFETYAQDRMAGRRMHIGVRAIFEKILRFLRRVGNSLRGLGFQTAEDIFKGAYQGRYAQATPRETPLTTGELASRINLHTTAAAIRTAASKVAELIEEFQIKVAPMAQTGADEEFRAAAKDTANEFRNVRHEYMRRDKVILQNFDKSQRESMWVHADQENVAQIMGVPLPPDTGRQAMTRAERAVTDSLVDEAGETWREAQAVGVVPEDREGLPYYVPRMMVFVDQYGRITRQAPGEGYHGISGIGKGFHTSTPQTRRRKYLTAAETEAAMKQHFGQTAQIAKDIRTLALATMRLKEAIAARVLVNKIKALGNLAGQATVNTGGPGQQGKWFTLDHPAFFTWEPILQKDPQTGKWKQRHYDDGTPAFRRVPIYIRSEFKGPLLAVLGRDTGKIYQALLSIKMRSMSVIMYSPAIHNIVEYSRSWPSFPYRMLPFTAAVKAWRGGGSKLGSAAPLIYWEGNRAKHDPDQMREAILAGMVPIGERFFGQDVTTAMEDPMLDPGRRSWTAQLIGFVPGLFNPNAGEATRQAIAKAGDFWHNTLLWDRIGDLQMGLYVNFRKQLIKKGFDAQTASRIAAHFANRYAGALPIESMSTGARMFLNMLLFSRTFTLGNLGAFKDAISGLPRDVQDQILRDAGPLMEQKANKYTRRKTRMILFLDIVLGIITTSILADIMKKLRDEKDWPELAGDYVGRFLDWLEFALSSPGKIVTEPIHSLWRLSSTMTNEPRKQQGSEARVLLYYDKNGRAVFGRNPFGKIGEEFAGWPSAPGDMLNRKLSPMVRAGIQIFANDKYFGAGFDRPARIWKPSPEGWEWFENAGRMAWWMVRAHLPAEAMDATYELLLGEENSKKDALTQALKIGAPFAGVSISQGHPKGYKGAFQEELKRRRANERLFGQ